METLVQKYYLILQLKKQDLCSKHLRILDTRWGNAYVLVLSAEKWVDSRLIHEIRVSNNSGKRQS